MKAITNSQSPYKSIRRFIVISMMVLVSFSAVMAGPGNATRQKSKLASQVKKMVENVSPTDASTLTGEAVIFFRVDDKGSIEVKGVFGTNEELLDHVENALNGELIKVDGLDTEQEYQVRLKYTDLR